MNIQNALTGVLSALLACTGSVILVIDAAESAGFSRTELISWVFAVFVIVGILNLILPLLYKIPFAGPLSACCWNFPFPASKKRMAS